MILSYFGPHKPEHELLFKMLCLYVESILLLVAIKLSRKDT